MAYDLTQDSAQTGKKPTSPSLDTDPIAQNANETGAEEIRNRTESVSSSASSDTGQSIAQSASGTEEREVRSRTESVSSNASSGTVQNIVQNPGEANASAPYTPIVPPLSNFVTPYIYWTTADKLVTEMKAEIKKLDAKQARERLIKLGYINFYTHENLILLFDKLDAEAEQKKFTTLELWNLFRILDEYKNNLELDKLAELFKRLRPYFDDKDFASMLFRYPHMAKILSSEVLQGYAKESPELAKSILLIPELAQRIAEDPAGFRNIYEAHPRSLFLCEKKIGLDIDVLLFEDRTTHLPENNRLDPQGHSKALVIIRNLENRRKQLEGKKSNLTGQSLVKKQEEIDACIKELRTWCGQVELGKWTLDVLLLKQSTETERHQSKLNSIDLIKYFSGKHLALIDERHIEAMFALLDNREEPADVEKLKTIEVDLSNAVKELRAARDSTEEDDCKRINDLIQKQHKCACLQAEGKALIDKIERRAADSKEMFLDLLKYLQAHESTKKTLETFLQKASNYYAENPKLSEKDVSYDSDIQTRAYQKLAISVYQYGYLFDEENLEVRRSKKGRGDWHVSPGHKFLSECSALSRALFSIHPETLAHHINRIKDTGSRLAFLQSNLYLNNVNHLLNLSLKMIDRRGFKHFLHKSTEGKKPLTKLQEDIDKIVLADANDKATAEKCNKDHELLALALKNSDFRGWLNLRRARKNKDGSNDNRNYVGLWLENARKNKDGDKNDDDETQSKTYNDEVAKIIAQDSYLFKAIEESKDTLTDQPYTENSGYLRAAKLVQNKINDEKSLTSTGKDEFIQWLITKKINIKANGLSGKDKEKEGAAQMSEDDYLYWYVANNKDLWQRLQKAYIPSTGWLNWLRGRRTKAIMDKENELSNCNQFFEEQFERDYGNRRERGKYILRRKVDSLLENLSEDNKLSEEDSAFLIKHLQDPAKRRNVKLGRKPKGSNETFVKLWLKATSNESNQKYNDDVAKIVAQDPKLFKKVNAQTHYDRNDYLWAAHYVEEQISRGENAFIERVINAIDKNEKIAPDSDSGKQEAVCWYIANKERLWEKCKESYTVKNGLFEKRYLRDKEKKLLDYSDHFKSKYTPKEIALIERRYRYGDASLMHNPKVSGSSVIGTSASLGLSSENRNDNQLQIPAPESPRFGS